MSRSIIFSLMLLSSTVFCAENSMQNMFNNTTGSIGTVNISQLNSMTNEQFESSQKISDLMIKAQQMSQNATTPEQRKEAMSLMTFGGMAKEINAQPATNKQKEQMCDKQVEINISWFGYEFSVSLKKECHNLFPN